MHKVSSFSGVALLTVWVFISIFVVFSSPAPGYIKGDINNDGKIDLREAIHALQVVSGLKPSIDSKVINVPGDAATIQQAYDMASKGDTINVGAGTYTGPITIIAKPVILQGAGKDATIINGNQQDAIIIDGAMGVVIKGFTIQQGNVGILAKRGTTLEVRDTVVQDMVDDGIKIDENSHARLTNVTVLRSGDKGIQVSLGSGASFFGTIASNNNGTYGILVLAGSNALFWGATVTANVNNRGIHVANNSSLFAYNSSAVTVQNNQDRGIGTYGGSSIQFTENSSLLSENNVRDGLFVGSSSSFYSDSSSPLTIRNAGRYGILVTTSSNAEISGTALVEKNGVGGILVNLSSSLYFSGVVNVLDNTGYGLIVQRSSSVEAAPTSNLTVSGTTGGDGFGIFIGDSAVLTVSGSVLVENTSGTYGWGVGVGRNSQITLRPASPNTVTIQKNGSYGLQVYSQSSGRLYAGTSILNNIKQGIGVYENSQLYAAGTFVQNNGLRGIDADNGSVIGISDSTINGNTGGDIALFFGSRATLNNNTIEILSCDATSQSRGTTLCPP